MIDEKLKAIYAKAWVIVIVAAVPFVIVVIAFAWQAQTLEDLVKTLVILFFVMGIGLIAAKLSSYSIVNRNLQDIEKLDKAKTDFIAVAAHQLKSPVVAIRWRLEDIEACVNNKEWHTVAAKIKDLDESVGRFSKLAEDLLDVTMIDTGKIQYEPVEINIDRIIGQIITDMTPLAQQNQMSIIYQESGEGGGIVYCDPKLLTNVMQNLVSNALKYSPSHADIIINAQVNGPKMDITVTNQSTEPVTEDILRNLFQKFYRTDAAREKQADGSGLGLFIVKSYVEKWGGTITASSKSNNELTFMFSVSLHRGVEPQA